MENLGLPDGVSLGQVLAVLVPVAVVTIALRQLPFSFLSAMRGSPLVSFLGVMMPVGVMVILVIYTLVDQFSASGGIVTTALGVAVTLGLHAWKRSPALSILGGTAAYVVLVNLIV